MARKSVSLDMATRLINHGPVVMVGSMYDDRMDVTPVAWHMPVQKKDPPMIVLEIGEKHFIYECIMRTGDFTVNIPPATLLENIVKCGSVSGRDVDKIEMCGFTPAPSRKIKSPGIEEAVAILECALIEDKHLLGEYNMVLGEVKYAEAEESVFKEHWLFDKAETRTVHHLGNRTFCMSGREVVDLR